MNTGFNDDIGSWKIIAISFPQILRNSATDRLSKSLSSKRIWLCSEIWLCPFGNNPITANEVTDLPLPDSPTKATVLFFGILNEIPLTVLIHCLLSDLKLTSRFSTFNNGDSFIVVIASHSAISVLDPMHHVMHQ